MALKFGDSHGSAIKSSIDTFPFVNGDNRVRLVGDILPRYVYWIKGTNGKNIPMECLSFDRDSEAFLNKEKDWVREYYPKEKCTWSYVVQCVHEGKIKVVNLKKKLWEQVITTAKDLGDPTDPVDGWDLCFERKKTGPLAYNVEYQLQVLRCQKAKRPLTEEELALVAEMTPIDEVMPRPTSDAQKELLERLRTPESSSEHVDNEAIDQEFAVD